MESCKQCLHDAIDADDVVNKTSYDGTGVKQQTTRAIKGQRAFQKHNSTPQSFA